MQGQASSKGHTLLCGGTYKAFLDAFTKKKNKKKKLTSFNMYSTGSTPVVTQGSQIRQALRVVQWLSALDLYMQA